MFAGVLGSSYIERPFLSVARRRLLTQRGGIFAPAILASPSGREVDAELRAEHQAGARRRGAVLLVRIAERGRDP
jgi:hypothetical protein